MFAFHAPSIWTSGVCLVPPEETDTITAVNRVSDVLAHEPDAAATMNRALHFLTIHHTGYDPGGF